MNAIAVIISDLHIGSRYFLADRFAHFLTRLPDGAALVLAGDTVHNRGQHIPSAHEPALDLICRESQCRKVVWLPGNHDHNFRPDAPNNIQFAPSYAIAHRLHVSHGTEFMPFPRFLRLAARILRPVSSRAGREHMSVRLARTLPPAYRLLRRGMMVRAVAFAQEHGFGAIACGHVHAAEDVTYRGVRYINTATWTESPTYCLVVDEEVMALKEVPEC